MAVLSPNWHDSFLHQQDRNKGLLYKNKKIQNTKLQVNQRCHKPNEKQLFIPHSKGRSI